MALCLTGQAQEKDREQRWKREPGRLGREEEPRRRREEELLPRIAVVAVVAVAVNGAVERTRACAPRLLLLFIRGGHGRQGIKESC